MGLTIHYRLAWPAGNLQDARQAVEKLRQRCLDLPFETVGRIRTFEGEACDYDRYSRDNDARWLLIQSRAAIYGRDNRNGRFTACAAGQDWNAAVDVIPTQTVAFSAWPGQGCEEANLGLRLLPDSLTLHTDRGEPYALAVPDKGWNWKSFCKTQYANDPRCGGIQNFLRCHLTVIASLDAAQELGFRVEVSDEGGFWEKRSVAALAREIGEWDRHLAALVGAFTQRIREDGMTVEAPIAERPDFEHLEAEGVLDPKLQKVIETVLKSEPRRAA